ncbi:HIG1 domain-containing protein [Novosphingobium sp.]|uniref:HIG1 domain-containing protein n=1 Tax=Novosphingobium sp. TaxID=1874826 RepID=UPI0025F53B85|nr:HIG1 domain-containing protein [Novosphingobium sp.]MCC6927284.1 HIG1 domain-containing protein [Novosphingobium sp.]
MSYILIPIAVVLMVMTVITLVRGIAAFLQSTREDLDRPEGSGPSAMQLRQNHLMFRRILFQAAAILVVALLMFANKQ